MAEKKATQNQYHYGVGRRKTAVAQVRLYTQGSGKISVNDKPVTAENQSYLAPLQLAGMLGNTDLTVKVHGGGFSGQEEAIRHGISRALVAMDEGYKTSLRKAGYLTRDPREKERQKPGLKGARRSPQWSKR
jgi:small subunit ribosomal protein S9